MRLEAPRALTELIDFDGYEPPGQNADPRLSPASFLGSPQLYRP
jgi:hypothetical protein